MENLLVKLMLFAALAQLGISVSDLLKPESKSIQTAFEKRSKDILRIDWKPLTVFPKEVRRFQ